MSASSPTESASTVAADPDYSHGTHLWGLYIGLGLHFTYHAVALGMLISMRNKEPIRSRGWMLTAVAVTWSAIDTAVSSTLPGDVYVPCYFVMWIQMLFTVNICFPHVLRALMLFVLYRWNSKKMTATADDEAWFRRYRLFVSMPFLLSVQAAAVVFTLATTAAVRFSTDPPMQEWNASSLCSGVLYQYNIAQAALLLACFVLCLIILFPAHDGYHFKTELKFFAVLFVVFYSFFAAVQLGGILPLEWDTITPMLGTFCATTIAVYYPIYMARQAKWNAARPDTDSLHLSSSADLTTAHKREDGPEEQILAPKKDRIKVRTYGELLEFIFATPTLLAAFRRCAFELWCIENVLFYEDVLHFSTVPDGPRRVADARRICALYVQENAAREINVDDEPRHRVVNDIKTGNVSGTIFTELKLAVFTQMKMDTLPKFRLTPEFDRVWAEGNWGPAPQFKKATTVSESVVGGQVELSVGMSHTAEELIRESMSGSVRRRTLDDVV